MTRRTFGRSWWGQAWIDALEQRVRLDQNRLSRGRTYARKGKVYPLTVRPGSVAAYVKGSRAEPYHVELEIRAFTDEEWRTLLEVIVAKVDHIAALVDGELDPALAEDAAEVGVHLLPERGEIDPWCSCPDWATPCKHSAAVCYRMADSLDADPFALLELRGRTRDQIVAAVRRLRTAATDDGPDDPERAGGPTDHRPGPPVDEGTAATEAWGRRIGPLPSVPHLRAQPGRPIAQPVDPPADATFTAAGLETLAVDAASRAWAALADRTALDLDAGFDDDAIRRAVVARNGDGFGAAARRLGTSPQALARRAAAWEVAGRDGLAVSSERKWRADPLVMSAARLAVEEVLRGHVRGTIDGNRLTLGERQLRLSRTGHWWSFEKHGAGWQLLAGPAEAAEELVEPRPGRRR